jgi:predicted anti-sigma-YlaC factor YlaD
MSHNECEFTLQIETLLQDGQELTLELQKHLDGCDECKEYMEFVGDLNQTLTKDQMDAKFAQVWHKIEKPKVTKSPMQRVIELMEDRTVSYVLTTGGLSILFALLSNYILEALAKHWV